MLRGSTFSGVVPEIQRSFDRGKQLAEVSFLHRVLELGTAHNHLSVPDGWVVSMVSYLDVRRLPDAAIFGAVNANVFGDRGSSEEVFLWVTYFPDEVSSTLMHPGTGRAREASCAYVDRMCTIFQTIAATGHYRVRSCKSQQPSVAAGSET